MRPLMMWVIVPLVVYSVIAGVITWPLVQRLDTHTAGASYGDTYMMLRQAWAARESVLDGRNPLHQDLLAYPNGFTSRLMWSTPLRWFPVMVLSLVVPPVVAFNLWIMITVVLNGLTAYWLGLELSERHIPAALLGGLVFTAFPNMQGHLAVGHIDVLAMYGLPIYALCAWRVLRREAGWLTVCGGGAAFALASLGLTSQIIYNLMPVALFLGLYHLLLARDQLFRPDRFLLDQPWLKFGAMILFGGAILLIFFAPLMTDAGRGEIENLRETGRVTFSADALAFVSPSLFGPLEKWGLVPDYARDVLGTNSTEGSAYVGIVALALVIIGVITRREARPWLLVALGAMIFSLGPLLKWRDQPVIFRVEEFESYVTLPWAALQDWPILEATRTPGRFNGATALAWGALVSVGAGVALRGFAPRSPLRDFEQIFVRRSGGRGVLQYAPTGWQTAIQAAITLVLGIVILIEYQLFWPYATLDAAQPAYFSELADMDDVRAVINVPIHHPLAQMNAMFQQTIHAKPMIGGQLYRRTPQNPALLAVLDRATAGITPDLLLPMRDEDARYLLSQVGADRVIVHRLQLADAGDVVKRLKAILGPAEYKNPFYEVYAVPRVDTPPDDMGLIFAASPEGWSAAVDLGALTGAFLAESGEWYLYAPRETVGELIIPMQPYSIPRRVGVWLDDHLIAAWWADNGSQGLPLWVTPGFHTLRFEALDGCDFYPFTLTCFAGDCAPQDPPVCISVAHGLPEWIENDTALTPLDAQLDHGLRLRAYDRRVDAAAGVAHLRLFWETDGSLPTSYALFAHIADPVTAEPLAQYTGFPLISTDEWGAAAWVSDIEIALPENLPGGEYALNVGWFVPDTGERIAVKGDRPWAAAGLVFLEMMETAHGEN
jgi:hypothetical protein